MTTQTGAPDQDRPGAPGAGGGALHSQDTAADRQAPSIRACVVVDVSAATPAECLDVLRNASLIVKGRRVILRTGAVGPAGLHAAELLGNALSIDIHADGRYIAAADEWSLELETLA